MYSFNWKNAKATDFFILLPIFYLTLIEFYLFVVFSIIYTGIQMIPKIRVKIKHPNKKMIFFPAGTSIGFGLMIFVKLFTDGIEKLF